VKKSAGWRAGPGDHFSTGRLFPPELKGTIRRNRFTFKQQLLGISGEIKNTTLAWLQLLAFSTRHIIRAHHIPRPKWLAQPLLLFLSRGGNPSPIKASDRFPALISFRHASCSYFPMKAKKSRRDDGDGNRTSGETVLAWQGFREFKRNTSLPAISRFAAELFSIQGGNMKRILLSALTLVSLLALLSACIIPPPGGWRGHGDGGRGGGGEHDRQHSSGDRGERR
jgi:hypothetical protein